MEGPLRILSDGPREERKTVSQKFAARMGNNLLRSETLLVKMRKNNAESQESNGVTSSEGAGGAAPYLGMVLVGGAGRK